MTSYTQEHTFNGTPSGNRDASRVQEESNNTNQLRSTQALQFDEKLEKPTASSDSECGDNVPAPLKRNGSYFKRPTISRQNTQVSIAAAPYGGVFCCDLDHTASNLDHATAPVTALSRASTAPRRPRSGSSSSSASTLRELPSALASASRVSTDAYGNTYPEGGLEAWLCVFGSFCGLMGALGMMNTIGTLQAYISTHQLESQTESAIGWIFGIYAFLSFFCGIQIGPVFDAKGPRWLIAAGSVLIVATWLLLGVCSKYWHFLVVFGVLGGLGTSLVFTPAIAAVGHFFLRKRGQFTGLAAVGGSLGGIVYPLVMQALFPKIGFAWTTRVIGLVNLVLLIFANLFIKSRLPPRPATREAIMPDFRIFRDPTFALTTLGVFFVEWGLFVPLSYIVSYALAHGVETSFAYQLIAILNAGSCAGRYFPGLIADYAGRFNAMVVTIFFCLASVFGLWLPSNYLAESSKAFIPLIVVFAIFFGFASGSGIGLTPVCVGQLCKVENYGRYYATCYTVVSFGSLTGIPIAGQLVQVCNGRYWGLILFTGGAYAASNLTFLAARIIGGGRSLKTKY